jgi:endonuclease/exonuclease/phosphatase family metal-dependent hydrolase
MTQRLRIITLNLLTLQDASGQQRQEVVRQALPELRPDVVALQEVTRGPHFDQAAYLLGKDFTIVDLPGRSPSHTGECLASRWPLGEVTSLDVTVADGAEGLPRATAVAAEVLAPAPFGTLLAVHHRGTYELQLEHVRERQALATARFVEDLVSDRPDLPVVLLGDLNADSDAASIRFLTGKQSRAGTSVRYEDAWAATHPDAPGHTFSPRNPLVRAGEMPLERGRRIDYIMIRSGAHGPTLDVAECRLIFDEPVDGVWASDHYGLLADLQLPDHSPGTWAVTPTNQAG